MTLSPIDLLGAAVLGAVLAGLAADTLAGERRLRRATRDLDHAQRRCGCTDRGGDLPCPAAAPR